MTPTSLSKAPFFLKIGVFDTLYECTRGPRPKLKNTPFNAFFWSRMCAAIYLTGPPGTLTYRFFRGKKVTGYTVHVQYMLPYWQ